MEFVADNTAVVVTAGVIILAGIIIDAVIFRILRARSASRHWRVGKGLASALRGLPSAAAVLIAARVLLMRLELSDRVESFANKGLSVTAIVIGTAFAARIAGKVITAYSEREDSRLPSSTIFVNLARGFVWVIGGLLVLSALGISIVPLITALGVGGLAVGLALQPTLENVISGLQVLGSRQIEPGDFIQLETGQQGYVEDVTWRNTTIKLLSNDLVIVPNATIGKSLITNFTSEDEQHITVVLFSVGYDADLDEVERVALDVAAHVQQTAEGGVPEHEPSLRYIDLADSAVRLQVALRADSFANRVVLRHAFIKALYQRFASEGIRFPYPHTTVEVLTAAE